MPDVNDPNHEPENFADLPLQPTGSGVADLEIARTQMQLSDDDRAADASVGAGIADETAAYAQAATPTEGGPAEDESEAQPS